MANRIIESLSFDIEAVSNNAIKSLENAYKSINKLKKSLVKIQSVNLSGITNKFSTMTNAINKFEKVSNEALSKMSNMARSFGSINSLIKNVSSADMNKLASQFKQLDGAITPFLRTLQMNQPVLADFAKSLDMAKVIGQYDKLNAQAKILNEKLNTQAQKTEKEKINREKANVQLKIAEKRLENINNQQNKLNAQREKANVQLKIAEKRLADMNNKQQKLNTRTTFWTNLWKMGKLGYAIRVFGRIANSLVRIVQLSADFDESLNKFQSATQEYYYDAIKFANNLSDSFGLAKATILDYQATFMNMLNALGGLDEGVANKLSQNLTIMAIDYASLFNTSIEQAMEAFQSMLSGRTMAIRTASGIDVTDNTIYEYYKELGGTKTRTALTQLEKRLLRILAVYQQMNASFAVSDYAETIENFSNEARILKEQIQELGTWIGNLGIRYLEPAMRYINAFIITLKEMVKTLAIAMGYEEQKPKNSILNAIENGATSATEAVEQLENTLGLLSIDKFEVLGGSKTSSSAIGGDISLIQQELDKEMKKLQESMEGITYQAKQISEEVLKWFGFIEQVNEKTGEVTYKLKDGYTTIEKIGNIIASIGISLITSKLTALIAKIATLNGGLLTTQSIMFVLNKVALFGLIYSLMTLITQWDELDTKLKAVYISLAGISTVMMFIANFEKIKETINALRIAWNYLKTSINGTYLAMGAIVGLAGFLILNMENFSQSTKDTIKVVSGLVTALSMVAISIMAIKRVALSAIPTVALAGIASFAVGLTAIQKSTYANTKGINACANGGFPERGELFIAREKGPEMVGTMNGRTSVANNYQIVEGIKSGVKEAIQESGYNNSNGKIEVGITDRGSGSALARALLPFIDVELKRTGGTRL